MKRFCIILNIVLLSALLVMVSGGITIVHCNHTGSVRVAQLGTERPMMQDDEAETMCPMFAAGGDCCKNAMATVIDSMPCMDYTTISAQPTTLTHGFDISLQPHFILLPGFIEQSAADGCHVAAQNKTLSCGGRHGPPRLYLRLITVLQI